MTLQSVLNSLVDKLGKVLVFARNALGNLDQGGSLVKVEVVAILRSIVFAPVGITYKVTTIVVDKDSPVEAVEFQTTILPAFLLPLQIVGEEADVFQHRSGRVPLPTRP